MTPSNTVIFDAVWPEKTYFPEGALTLWFSPQLEAPQWQALPQPVPIPAGAAGMTFELPRLPPLDESAVGFFRPVGDNDVTPEVTPDGSVIGEPPRNWRSQYGLDPFHRIGGEDPDGDGRTNFEEYCEGTDPTDAASCGYDLPSTNSIALDVSIGSDAAAWDLEITGRGPTDFGTRHLVMPKAEMWITNSIGFCKGNSYTLRLAWRNNDRLLKAGNAKCPWHCWEARVNGRPNVRTRENWTLERISGVEEFIVGEGYVIDNREGLLTDHVHKNSTNGIYNAAAGIEALLHVYKCEIAICNPGDNSWTEIAESRVILDDEDLRIMIRISPAIPTFDLCCQVIGSNVVVSTSGTCPNGAAIPIDPSEFTTFSTHSEVKMTRTRAQLIALGLLPSQDDDGVDEMAWLDMASGSGQSLADSEAFAGLGYADRGTSCSDASKTLTSTPPNSIPSESYFKAAGREIVVVAYGGVASDARQLMNQADIFYFSGHGNHATGAIQGGFTPSMASSYWNRDLDCAIIAGCAVLDVRNYRLNTQKFLYRLRHYNLHGTYPGEQWENCGAKHLLGYALKAPLDSRGGTVIAERFVEQMKAGRSVCESWRVANDCSEGRNACIIDCSVSPHEFWFWDESLGHAVWTNKVKGISGWIEN